MMMLLAGKINGQKLSDLTLALEQVRHKAQAGF